MLDACARSRPPSKEPGIALITTVAAVALVMMLLGAFFISHRSQLALASRSDDSKACQDTLWALAEYCRFRFEQQKSWTTVPFSIDPEVVRDDLDRDILSFDLLTQEEFEARPDLQNLTGAAHLVGEMPANGVTYHLAVNNRLMDPNNTVVDGVPAKACRVRIEARRGGATEAVELLLRRAALFDSTVFASEMIDVDAAKAYFNSNDPVRNQIRSLHSVELPDTENLHFRYGELTPPAVKGTVWAQDPDSEVGGRGSISIGGDSSYTKLQQAAESTGAQFYPDNPKRYNPPQLQDVNIEPFATTPMELTPATYFVTEARVQYTKLGGETDIATVKTVQKFEPQDFPTEPPSFPDDANGPPREFYLVKNNLPPDADPLVATALVIGGTEDDPVLGPTAVAQNADTFSIPGGPKVTMNPPGPPGEWSPILALPAETKLTVRDQGADPQNPGRSDFRIFCHPAGVPEIRFAKPDGSPGKGMIDALRDITLQGKMTGTCQLISGRDIELTPVDVEAVADYDSDVAIFAKDDVRIRPLEVGSGSSVLQRAGYFVFKGLVYAGGDFEFFSDVGISQYQRHLNIEGALVARNGHVSVQSNGDLTVTYEPEYLDKYLEMSTLEEQLQIEELSWRPL